MPFVSSSTGDPYANAAVESLLFDLVASTGPILFVYVNDPCVVIGRHQNPWVECNMPAMREAALPLVRRISGGGTVYHDPGNINFSFLAQQDHYDLDAQFTLVLRSLAALGVEALRNERNDLVLGGRKVSGNAFRHSRGNSLHHGTLLVEADLTRLVSYLAAPATEIQTRAIASVRSTVVNLAEKAAVNVFTVTEALAREFASSYGDTERVATDAPPAWFPDAQRIREERERLAGWEWVFGHTPGFSRTYRDASAGMALTVEVRKGHIEQAVIEQAGKQERLAILEGRKLRREIIDIFGADERFRNLRDTMMEDLW